MNIIFLDVDGVLNCQLFYTEQQKNEGDTFVKQNLCHIRVGWLNELCKEMDIKVVVSSTWRMGKTMDELKEIFTEVGATFDIIGMTPILREKYFVRGNEIQAWIEQNNELLECQYYDFHTYAIIDDDSDMLYWQRNNLFLTDSYSGITPNTCYCIKRFFEKFNHPITTP